MILQRSTLTAQPQGPVEVDWNNPLTRGLLTLAIPRGDTMYCVVNREQYVSTTVRPTVGTSLSGLGQRSVNSTIAFSHLPLTAFDLGDATIAVRQVCATLVASARPAGFSRSSSINPAFRVDQNPSAQARPRFGILNNSGTSLGTITSGASDPVRFSATQAFTMVTAADVSEVRAVSEGFVYTPVARTAGTTTIDRFSVGGQSSSTDRLGFEGFVFVAAAWTRALSAVEMAEVDQNIWQLFVQPRGRSMVAFGFSSGANVAVTPDKGSLVFGEYVPAVSKTANQSVLPDKGALTLVGYAPTVSISANQSVSPDKGVMVFGGYAPSVLLDAVLSPTKGSIVLQGHVPTISQSSATDIVPNTGSMFFSGHAPSVSQTGNIFVSPPTGSALITGYAPLVSNGGAVYPDPSQVLAGVLYGPNGIDYVGTLVAAGGAYMRRR